MTHDGGITVVVPVRDEAATIAAALESLAAQTVGPAALEVLVFDGMSRDRTAAIARSYAERAPWRRFVLAENPARTVPHALNAGLADSRCRWWLRVDGRARLSPSYLEACLAQLAGAPPLTAAGGRFAVEADGAVGNAIGAVVTHPLGVGRGFRTAGATAAEVPHHPFAVWRTDEVRELGGFRPELTRNQDDEFSMRARGNGARILTTPAAEVVYRPRDRFRGLAMQYFQYGLWKSAVARRYGLFPPRSALPATVAVGAGLAAAGAATGRAHWPVAVIGAMYATLGIAVSRGRPRATPILTGAALATVHVSYGTGILAGALRPALAAGRLGRNRVR